MAKQRLSDQTEKQEISANPLDLLTYVMDTDDTTDHPDGSGFKMRAGNLLKRVTFVKMAGGCLVYRPTDRTGVAGEGEYEDTFFVADVVFYIDAGRLIIGTVDSALFSSIPDDFDDSSLFTKYIETVPFLP